MTTDAKRDVPVRAPAPAEGLVRVAHPDPAVAVITLNAPATRNSLSRRMMAALEAEIAVASADADVATVVIDAAGPVFSAGHDLKELTRHRADADGGRAFYDETMQACARLMQAIVRSPKPVIAAVQGVATAAGCQLVASCDLAVAASTATFATPGVNIGLFCSTPMVALSRNIPRKRAMEMLLLGEMLSAADAALYGLVNRVVPPERVGDEARAMARIIASKSMATVAVGKEAFYRQLEEPLAEAYAYAAAVMVENMMARDAAEGIGAFLEKRPPRLEKDVMEPRLSFVTLGVSDVARSRAFYEKLGFRASSASNESVTFFDAGGPILALFGRRDLADDAAVKDTAPGFSGVALAHNVRSEAEVTGVLAEAEAAGATILKPAKRAFWGGYSGYFADPDGHVWEVAFNPGFPLDADGRVTLP